MNKDGKVLLDKLVDKENAGAWAAIAVDVKNRAHIAYQAGGAGPGLSTTLRYAVDDGAHWTITDVSPGGCAASLMLNLNGNPEIAQVGGAGCAGPLEYDWFDGSSWHTDPLGQSADPTSATGIAQGNLLNIVFTDPSGALMDGEDGASGWTFTQIAPSGRDASISWPNVAYTNTAQNEVDYATNNGALWSSSIIAASASNPKIAFSGTSKVSYIDNTSQELTYARLDNGGWSVTSLGTGYGASAIALNQ